jgi:hypothetical protein
MASKKKNHVDLTAEVENILKKAGQSVNSAGNSISNRYNSTTKWSATNHVKIVMGSERPQSSKRGGAVKYRGNKVIKKVKPGNQTDKKSVTD